MISATSVLLFLNAERIPFMMEDSIQSCEVAQFAEDIAIKAAMKVAEKQEIKVTRGSKAIPAKKSALSKHLVLSNIFHSQYESAIRDLIKKETIDGIALIPGCGEASESPFWLLEMAKTLYIPVAPFESFFGNSGGSFIQMETSRRRRALLLSKIPLGRSGRGGRTK